MKVVNVKGNVVNVLWIDSNKTEEFQYYDFISKYGTIEKHQK